MNVFYGFLMGFQLQNRGKNKNPDLYATLFRLRHGQVNYRTQVLLAFLNCGIQPYQMVHFQFAVFELPIDKEYY